MLALQNLGPFSVAFPSFHGISSSSNYRFCACLACCPENNSISLQEVGYGDLFVSNSQLKKVMQQSFVNRISKERQHFYHGEFIFMALFLFCILLYFIQQLTNGQISVEPNSADIIWSSSSFFDFKSLHKA